MKPWQFALRISGPIDALISGSINFAFPFFLIPASASLDWFGLPSLYAFLAPMSFFSAACPYYFGVANGVRLQRQSSSYQPNSLENEPFARWRSAAAGRAILLGILCFLAISGLVYGLANGSSTTKIPAVIVTWSDALLSAALAFTFQVLGVITAQSYSGSNSRKTPANSPRV